MMPSKKARLPKLVERHPFYPGQYSELNKTEKDFTKPSKDKPMPLNRTDKNIQFALKVLQLCKHVHYDTYNEDEKKFYILNVKSKTQTDSAANFCFNTGLCMI